MIASIEAQSSTNICADSIISVRPLRWLKMLLFLYVSWTLHTVIKRHFFYIYLYRKWLVVIWGYILTTRLKNRLSKVDKRVSEQSNSSYKQSKISRSFNGYFSPSRVLVLWTFIFIRRSNWHERPLSKITCIASLTVDAYSFNGGCRMF